MDEEAFEVAVDTAKSRVRELHRGGGARPPPRPRPSSPCGRVDRGPRGGGGCATRNTSLRIDAEIAEEKKGPRRAPARRGCLGGARARSRGDGEVRGGQRREKEQALKERIAEAHAPASVGRGGGVREGVGRQDGRRGGDLGPRTRRRRGDDEDSLPTNPLQLGWEIDARRRRRSGTPSPSRGALDGSAPAPLSALERHPRRVPRRLRPRDGAPRPCRQRSTPRREHAPARRAAARAHVMLPTGGGGGGCRIGSERIALRRVPQRPRRDPRFARARPRAHRV